MSFCLIIIIILILIKRLSPFQKKKKNKTKQKKTNKQKRDSLQWIESRGELMVKSSGTSWVRHLDLHC